MTIVYADDEERYRNLIKLMLRPEGYNVEVVENGLGVLQYLEKNREVDLILLDVMMPKLDGWETLKAVRSISDVPIIMLTALDDVHNEVKGLDIGADDYISKPFPREILVSRIKRILKRTTKIEEKLFEDEGIAFDDKKYVILLDGNEVNLTPKEFNLLKYMVLNRDIILSRDQILLKVWGDDYFGDSRTVDTHIKSVRASLGTFSSRIQTIRGRGYIYCGDNT